MGMKGASTLDQTKVVAAAVAQMLIDDTLVQMSDEISQAVILSTDVDGRVSWTYPRPFADPPVLSADVLSTGSNQPYALRELTRTNTGCSLQVLGAAVVSVLGISVLAGLVASGAGLSVHLVAKRATPPS